MTARLSDNDLRLLHANLHSAEDDLETTRRCLDLARVSALIQNFRARTSPDRPEFKAPPPTRRK